MRSTVVIPVFNEIATLEELLARVEAVDIDKEVIIVDDCSTDGTRELLTSMSQSNHLIVLHDSNAGKGAALRTGFRRARGDYVIVQDADLEYDPHDYVHLVAEARPHDADVVYGTRFAGARPQMAFKNWLGNRVLTWLTNRLYGSTLSDMETCYKVIRRDVLADLTIESIQRRAGTYREATDAWHAHPRGPYLLRWPDACRREEDFMDGFRVGGLDTRPFARPPRRASRPTTCGSPPPSITANHGTPPRSKRTCRIVLVCGKQRTSVPRALVVGIPARSPTQ